MCGCLISGQFYIKFYLKLQIMDILQLLDYVLFLNFLLFVYFYRYVYAWPCMHQYMCGSIRTFHGIKFSLIIWIPRIKSNHHLGYICHCLHSHLSWLFLRDNVVYLRASMHSIYSQRQHWNSKQPVSLFSEWDSRCITLYLIVFNAENKPKSLCMLLCYTS